ncbi:MAG TPA: acetyl-CoA C-acetyltransferase [Chloroflexia bacterium]|nr:acetyl-CoA C-acetyltransferase [Chloroflexia bacterium]
MGFNKDIVILDGARTPVGTFGGAFRQVTATQLGVVAGTAALARAGVAPTEVDNVVFGNVLQTSADAVYQARHIGLRCGIPREVPALTVNRLCGSGLQAILTAGQSILLDESQCALAGGTENLSQAPHVLYGGRWGLDLGQDGRLQDSLWSALTDSYSGLSMALTAENLAERYAISRPAQDAFALRSQQLAGAAIRAGRLAAEIVPAPGHDKRGAAIEVTADEHPRPEVTLESLARLKPRFKEGGTVTPGNASGINDAAAAVVVSSHSFAAAHKLQPLGRLVSWAVVGVDPAVMGIGPAPAIRAALKRADLTLGEIDLIEINEAFAAQYLAVEQELHLDRERVNVNGGAIALGHPLAASGTRLALTLLYELRRRGGRFGVAALCIGGGQGIAAVFERI